jgi:hypothetical protein
VSEGVPCVPKSESMQDVSISTGIVEAAAEGDGVVQLVTGIKNLSC